MTNANNYPSCIKIPSTNSKQSKTVAMLSQKFGLKEALALNDELISLANRMFGERKWSHSVTNQTIDFIEAFMSKYVCGCATVIRVQLQDGTFHEDIGYCHAEEAMKGLSIHYARIGSATDAFKKVLSCFGNEIENEVQSIVRCVSNSHRNNIHSKEVQNFFGNLESDIIEPPVQATPLVSSKENGEQKDKPVRTRKSKSPTDQKEQILIQQKVRRSKSPSEQTEHLKTSNDIKVQLQSKSTSHQKQQDTVQTEQDQKKAISDEDFLRMERKRKQMEKQAEYKRLMKEKEQQKSIDTKKPNPKY